MSRRRLLELLLARWGFAAMVATSIAVGFVVAVTVAPPTDLPSVALQAATLYRVEVGAAVFTGLYLATMVLALSFQNRGFTEIGSAGIRAQDLTAVSRREAVLVDTVAALTDEIQELRAEREAIEDGR